MIVKKPIQLQVVRKSLKGGLKMKKLYFALQIAVTLLTILVMSPRWSSAFDVWKDVQTQTNWDLGKSAAAGTAVTLVGNDAFNLKAGDFVPSFLAEISDYRMLSLWWGGNQFKLADGSTVLKDTAKLGFNLAYFFKDFTNQPPEIIKNLVVGPSISVNLVTSPHIFVPFLDLNYQFSK